MDIVPSALGWSEMSNGWPKRFAEYNSTTTSGQPVDVSGRKTTFGDGHANNPVLTAAEAAEAADMTNMYGEWDPASYTEQASAPTNVTLSGNTLAWDNSNHVFCWAIVKDGSVVDFTIEPTYEVDDAEATWAVRAANEMGGLGEATTATTKSWTMGDVNHDGIISVSDVTALVDYILGNDSNLFFIDEANVNGDEVISISDVTSLVDIILNGNN